MKLGRLTGMFLMCAAALSAVAAEPLPLDSCRNMALRNNKNMQIAREKIRGAEYQKKEAFAAYLPGIDFTGMYMYNQKDISLLYAAYPVVQSGDRFF